MPLYDSGVQYDLVLPSSVHEEILLDGPFHVVGDEEIELAVAVVVEPGRARRETGIGDAGLRRHIDERARPRVAKQAIGAERRDVEIGPAVVVVVAGGHAEPVELGRKTRGTGDVGERAVAVLR